MCWSRFILVFFGLFAALATANAQPTPTDAEFRAQIQRLDRKFDLTFRLTALKWLADHPTAKHADLALPALESVLRKDGEVKIREEAAVALGTLVKRLGKPCPLALVEAVLDENVYVRQAAEAFGNRFTTYPPGAVSTLLRGVASEDAMIRTYCHGLLARAAPGDERVLAIIDAATHDKIFQVRHNAHCAKFLANNNLSEFLTWIVRLQEDEEGVFYPVPEDDVLRKDQKSVRNLALVGTATQIVDWCETRPDELADALLQLLDNTSPLIRRGAARLIGAAVMKVNLSEPGKSENASLLNGLSYTFQDPEWLKKHDESHSHSEKSKACISLEKRRVRNRLIKVSASDRDPLVRNAAEAALRRLALVQEKAP
jgi:hypothetical protein